MDFNNIESLLRSGVTPETIAQDFTKYLNDAIVKAQPTKMELAARKIATVWNEMIDIWLEDNKLPEGMGIDDIRLDAEGAQAMFEGLMDVMVKLAPLYSLYRDMLGVEKVDKIKHENNEDKDTINNFDKVMAEWLNSLK